MSATANPSRDRRAHRPVPAPIKRLGGIVAVAAIYFGFASTFEPQRSQARQAEQNLHDSILKTRPAKPAPVPIRLAGEGVPGLPR